jgi:hypothetical protein
MSDGQPASDNRTGFLAKLPRLSVGSITFRLFFALVCVLVAAFRSGEPRSFERMQLLDWKASVEKSLAGADYPAASR